MKKKIKLTKKQKLAFDKIPSCSEIYSVYETKDFIEFVVGRWGDTCTYRVYNNGEVYER